MTLDIALRLRVHLLMGSVRAAKLPAIIDLTPGVRSLQIHYDSRKLPQVRLLETLVALEADLRTRDPYRWKAGSSICR